MRQVGDDDELRPQVQAAEDRIRRVLAAKDVGAADYWRSRGRERFSRELAEDRVPPEEAAALLDAIDNELFPPADLDELLGAMRVRLEHNPLEV